MSYFKLSFVVLFLSACSLTNKKNNSSEIQLSSVWVQDTLAEPNFSFRKINRMSPLIYKDQIIVANALDGIVSYNLVTKNLNWRINIPQGIEASGAMINDRLFIGSNNGKLYSINLSTGQIIWSFDTKSEVVAEPLLVDGVLYFLSGSQSVFSVDAVSGKQLWTYNRQDTSNLMTIRGGSKPSFSSGILYVGFSDGSVVAFNAKTGTQQWEITLNRNTRFKDIDSSPVIDGDSIYINSYDDKIYCLSKNKGELIWKSPLGGASTPVVFGDKLISTSSKGELFALSKKDGSLIWKVKTNNGLFVDPLIYKGFLVSGETQGKLNLFDSLTGEIKASFEPGRGVFSKPVVLADKNLIYFISGEGNLYGISIETKKNSAIYYLK